MQPPRANQSIPRRDGAGAAGSSADGFGFELDDEAWIARVRASATPPGLGRFGPYDLLEEIGRGGQGVIYRARQPGTGRDVAIKRLGAGVFSTPEMRARFEREIEAVAALDHPSVVTVFGSETVEGQPALLMQWIDGIPFDRWSTLPGGMRRGVREVLTIFGIVCDAVHHAHQRGVIHRDLKPSNVLVDRDDRPHVLDFGLAKLNDSSGAMASLTETGAFVGTLAYAAPEQLTGSHRDVDVRTDVYALGALLYQALTGVPPFEPSSDFRKLVDDVGHRSPRAPSSVDRRLNSELDSILLKALAKDRSLRYASVESFRADVLRYLAGQPVLAHPPNRTYRARKFARKHWLGVGVVAAFIALLAGFSGVIWVQFQREKTLALRNRELYIESQQRQKETQLVADFQASQFHDIDVPGMGIRLRADLLTEARAAMERSKLDAGTIDSRISELEQLLAGPNLTNVALKQLERDILDRAQKAIDEKFGDQPVVHAQLMQSLADTLVDLGLYHRAADPQTRALDIRRRVLGEEHPETLVSIHHMARILSRQGRYSEAEHHYREALDKRRRVLGDEHPATLESLEAIGMLLGASGRPAEAEEYCREVLGKARRVLGDTHTSTLFAFGGMGVLLGRQGKLAEAEPYLLEALETYRRMRDANTPISVGTTSNMGVMFQEWGKLAEAEEFYREALEKARPLLGNEHPETLRALNGLAGSLLGQGKFAEAELLLGEALKTSRRVLGDEHLNTIDAINQMGVLLKAEGKLADADPYCRESLEKRRRVLGNDHPETMGSIGSLARLLQAGGKASDAEPFFREALEICRRIYPGDHPQTAGLLHDLADVLRLLGKADEAEPLAQEAIAMYRAHPDWSPEQAVPGGGGLRRLAGPQQ